MITPPGLLHCLGPVPENIQHHLLNFCAFAYKLWQMGVILFLNLYGLEIVMLFQIIIRGRQLQDFIQQQGRIMGGNEDITLPGKTEHIGNNVSYPTSCLIDGFKHLGHFPGFHKDMDGSHGNAGRLRRSPVGRQIFVCQAVGKHTGGLYHSGQGIIDLMGHTCCKSAHGKHLFRLHHHLFQTHLFSHITKNQYHP